MTRAREILERDARGFAFLATRFRLQPTPLREHALRVVERLEGWDERITTAAHEAMAEFSGRSLGDIVADEAYRPGRGLADFARMLLEASEPLARPGPVSAEPLWAPARWVRGDGDFVGLLRQNAESAQVLEAAGVVPAPGPPSSAAFLGSFIHGFPAQALYRVAAYRAAAVRAGPLDPDLISDAALLEDPTGPLVRTLVLARRLGLARRTADGMEFRGAVLPDDLLEAARRLLADAQAVAEAGAFAVVLELVPAQLAAAITERLRIPTVGIGAGPGCSGQVQVVTDLLGLDTWRPKHARAYADLRSVILEAVRAYAADVAAGTFPSEAESVRMDDAVLDEVLGRSRLDRRAESNADLAAGASIGDADLAAGASIGDADAAPRDAGGWIPLDRDL